ncbi:Uma2 family endonuclease [Synechococcus sp. PCC 7502]|uniref:Uma2 family endonuclease n=1 Tax=Synechococcus sp. PCC 7502 TaxID=1173263 RepID=UPI0002F2236F|nr:Uma2 family endonuclease [Synechococcus sp. PCC 7502]
MTLLHSRIQGRIVRLWGNYVESSGIGGEVYTPVLPQSFPLIAEIVSPTDIANEVFAKADEYLEFGCEEVWLVFAKEKWIIVVTHTSRIIYAAEETLTSQVLKGFSTTVNALLGS